MIEYCTFSSLSSVITACGGCARLSWMVSVEDDDQWIVSSLVLIDDGVVQGILVLLQPTSNVVRYLQPHANSSHPSSSLLYTKFRDCWVHTVPA
jgi:hypothetical protein